MRMMGYNDSGYYCAWDIYEYTQNDARNSAESLFNKGMSGGIFDVGERSSNDHCGLHQERTTQFMIQR